MSDFYSMVPKGFRENLEYRQKVRARAAKDRGYRIALGHACKEDVLFWMNAFAWCYEPRPRVVDGKKHPHVLPFISWPHQDPVIRAIDEEFGIRDIGVDKSRGEGASWIGVLFAVHAFLYRRGSAVSVVSKDEKSMDTYGDKNSLFGKIDWELEQLPLWMAGKKGRDWTRNIANHTFRHHANDTNVTGYAATADVASGGRATVFIMDELAKFPRPQDDHAMASTEPVTECRLVISTPKGAAGAFYDLMHSPNGMRRLELRWEDNPTRNRGLYRLEKGRPVAVDPVNNPLLPDYDPPTAEVIDRWSRLRRKGFIIEGCERSEWFDERCDRPGMTPQFVAQEYQRSYGGSSFKIFSEEAMAFVDMSVREPVKIGNINYDLETLTPDFELSRDGRVKVWCPLDARNEPPAHRYVAGADISSGQGGSYTSNSVITILDLDTREQVLEYATNIVEPSDFADECIAICKWFHDAYFAWEHMGPGTSLTKAVLERGYGNIYRRTVEWRKGKKKTKAVGFVQSAQSREALFGDASYAIRHGGWQIRSKSLQGELPQYVRGDGGKIEHQQQKTTDDQSSQGLAHGDRVIAFGVAIQATKDRPTASTALENKLAQSPKYGTLAWRMKEDRESKKKEVWDKRTTSQLVSGGRDDLAKW